MCECDGSWHMFIKPSYFVSHGLLIPQEGPALPPWASTHIGTDSPVALKGGAKSTLFQSFDCPDPCSHEAFKSVEGGSLCQWDCCRWKAHSPQLEGAEVDGVSCYQPPPCNLGL